MEIPLGTPTEKTQTREATTFYVPSDLSLVLGGPIFQTFRRLRLSGDTAELLHRRIVAASFITWLPLLILAIVQDADKYLFFRDLEVHVRLLIALPILLAAEIIVHQRTRPIVKWFVERRIVRTEDFPKFEDAIESALRLRNSIALEVGLLIFTYTAGLWIWWHYVALSKSTWYGTFENGHLHLTLAGYWYAFVSIPFFQFLLTRWYLRLFIWFRFLWHVSKLNLRLIPTHPDRAAGLSFLGKSAYGFAPILFAEGTLLAGLIASRVMYGGQSLMSFKMLAGGTVLFYMFAILGPLLMFTPKLARAKRKGAADYGLLAQRYVEGFEDKWITENEPPRDELLGASDIQSLADLNNSYGAVREMRPFAFGGQDITNLAVATVAPLLPLLLLVFSFEQLVTQLVKVLF